MLEPKSVKDLSKTDVVLFVEKLKKCAQSFIRKNPKFEFFFQQNLAKIVFVQKFVLIPEQREREREKEIKTYIGQYILKTPKARVLSLFHLRIPLL